MHLKIEGAIYAPMFQNTTPIRISLDTLVQFVGTCIITKLSMLSKNITSYSRDRTIAHTHAEKIIWQPTDSASKFCVLSA
jgi:hypothetical protein